MANKPGKNAQSRGKSDLATQLRDLKRLTEQLSNIAESMQQASSAGNASADGSGSAGYGYSGA